MFMSSNVLIELLVNLLNDFRAPIMNLIIYKIDFLVELFTLVFILLQDSYLLIKGINFWRESISWSIWIILWSWFLFVFLFFAVFHLQVMKLLTPDFMISSKIFNFAFVFRDLHKKMRISLLSSQKFLNNFIYISQSSCSPDILESILNLIVIAHFIFHFPGQEFREQCLNQKFIFFLNFILILVWVCSHLSNFLLMLNSCDSSLKSLWFIIKRFVQSTDSFFSFLLILINAFDNCIKLHFGLNSILLSFSLIIRLFNNKIIFLF